MTALPEYITIGRFGRPKGVSGEIFITPATDFPRRFLELKRIYVNDGKQRREMTIESINIAGGRLKAIIAGIGNREKAAELTNMLIEIPGHEAVKLPQGSYYQFDLIGCKAIGRDGTDYGIVEEILFYPAHDIYRIVSEQFGEILFPVVDRFVIGIDIEKKKIIIDPPGRIV